MAIELPGRLAGAVWGHLVGDAIGVPYEFMAPSAIGEIVIKGGGAHNQPPGTWSDDGALMLATLASMVAECPPSGGPATVHEAFDPVDQAARFVAWVDQKAWTPDADGLFDIGGATHHAIDRLRKGVPAEQAGGTDAQSNGNGSLMRILPIALVERDVPDGTLVEHAHRSSMITHGHPIAQATCALYSLVIRRLLAVQSPEAALASARATLRGLYQDDAARTDALDTIETWSGRSGRGYVVDSFWSAWDAFAGARGYQDTIERAIRYGHDTDTTACIAGGLAGAFWGLDAIPADWLDKLRGHDIAGPLVDRLVQGTGRMTSTCNPIKVQWVDLTLVPRFADWTGALGMTFLPGKRWSGVAGEHWRDLRADAARLRHESHVDTFLVLVEDHELDHGRVPGLVGALEGEGMEVIRFPIGDGGVPADRDAFRHLLDEILDRMRSGRRVAVACRGGLGRTGTVVGCLLRDGGLDAQAAVKLTRLTRRHTIENSDQERFVSDWDWPATVGEADASAIVASALASVRPVVTMSRDGLVLIPLEHDGTSVEAGYLFLDEAIARGRLEIREIGTGSVPTLEAVTHDDPVVILAGDTLEGGKQNRVVNVSIWLDPGTVTPIPVTCLEHGRWNAPGSFAASRRLDLGMRDFVGRTVAASGRGEGARPAFVADQGAVWAEIERRQERSGVRSGSAALHDVYRAESADVEAFVRAFPRPASASGIAVAIGGRIVSLELFDRPDALARQWDRVVESAAASHLDHLRAVQLHQVPPDRHHHPDDGALGRMVTRAIQALSSAGVAGGVGSGLDLRLAGPKVHGSALVHTGLVHLELFRQG